jgi:xylan 1,4-beta-xylosidase
MKHKRGLQRAKLLNVSGFNALTAALALAVALWWIAPSGEAQAPASNPEALRIDAAAPTRPFPHFWETMFGSGRAILSLRESYRQDLRAVKKITGFQYVRFHAILDDEVGLYREDEQGKPVYNFSYIDQIYDGLRENGVRPMVELSFMPSALAASQKPHAFWYKPLPNPPKDYAKWGDLVHELAKHLVERYGIEEVAQWYFEVWNEPNIDFWTGNPKQATYFELYDHAARAIKRVSPRLRVGGPATAQAAWVADFIRHCVDGNVPVDYVSTHVYANDTSEDVLGAHEKIPRSDMVARAAKKVYDQVKASKRPDLPIIWSEYNASYMNEVNVTDSPFMGPWLANTIRQCDGLAAIMSYWTFSDVFEEQGVVKKPFYGGYGLIAERGIPKPAFNAFALLHMLGAKRLPLDSNSALATVRNDGSLAVAVWNYAAPEEKGAPRTYDLQFTPASGVSSARVRIIDAQHGSALTAWRTMGEPPFPTAAQIRRMREAARLPAPETRPIKGGRLTLVLEPHALALVEAP